MSKTNINPFGINGEMPEGYPMADNLVTNSAQKALTASMGVRLNSMVRGFKTIFVAASDASVNEKLAADYQCDGINDEVTIQSAVTELYNSGGGTVRLSTGTFIIDSFPNHDSTYEGGCDIAILIPSNDSIGFEINIVGDSMPMFSSVATQIVVSESCYRNLDANKIYKIFCCNYTTSLFNGARLSVFLSRFQVRLPWNQKKITCIDLRSANKVSVEFVRCVAYTSGFDGWTNPDGFNPPPKAVEGCVGLRMTSGSNYGVVARYNYIDCSGFYEGIQVGGEHVVAICLSGVYNVYSYSFGNYPWTAGFNHPITLINCCDERSVNLPLFAYCSESRNNSASGQQISIIDFNVERIAAYTPGKQLGDLARELVPGTFHGDISYTIQFQYGGSPLSTTMKFWEDGHGQRFQSRNSTQLLACDTTTRNSYAPNYLQRIWDTTLGKEVICVDTANKTWKDAMGNTV